MERHAPLHFFFGGGMPFEVTKTEWIYHGRAVHLRADTVRLPNGNETRLEIIEHVGSVVLIPWADATHIWFVRQYRHAAGCELLELPAGTLEPSEPAAECAARELQEEVGMAAEALREIGAFYLAPGYATEYMHVFEARDLRPSRLPGDDDEILQPELYSLQEIQAMLAHGAFQDSKTIAALALGLRPIPSTPE
jgi:ADP-ribose pyrophosphatase